MSGHRILVQASRGNPSEADRKSTRLNSSHLVISYAVFCLKKKNTKASTLVHPNQLNSGPKPKTLLRRHTRHTSSRHRHNHHRDALTCVHLTPLRPAGAHAP